MASAAAMIELTVPNDQAGWRLDRYLARALPQFSRSRLQALIRTGDVQLQGQSARPRETVHAQAFNVGRSDQNYRIREIAEIVKETVPGCEIAFARDAGPDKRNYRADFSKIGRLLPSFQPQWDARKGARQVYEACKTVGLKLEDFEGPRFRRIDQLKQLMQIGNLGPDLRWLSEPVAA